MIVFNYLYYIFPGIPSFYGVDGRVVERSDINLMHANNLAVVFSPTVMRDMTGARQITDMQATNMCVKFLIENANALFNINKISLSIDRSDNKSLLRNRF
jgi:RhoGAP domain